MAQMVDVNFKMDAELMESMEQACSELGMSITTAFMIFAKKVGRERRIPFEVGVDPFYTEGNMQRLEERYSAIKEGRARLVEHALIEVDD